MMAYYFTLVTELDWDELVTALAAVASVPVEQVEIGDFNDPDSRTWSTLVTCGYERTWGDTTWYLDITFTDDTPVQPPESEVAAQLADRLNIPVIYDTEGMANPDAHWLAAPGGRRTRARLREIEDPELPGLSFDAVEQRLPTVPDTVPVVLITEVIREYVMDSPAFDQFRDWYNQWQSTATGPAKKFAWRVRNRLYDWESLAMRMACDWPPDGWYPTEFYREDLEARDELASFAVDQLPAAAQELFATSLARIDQRFRDHTSPDNHAQLSALLDLPAQELTQRQWWWQRIPTRAAWHPDNALPNPDMTRTTPAGRLTS